MTLMAALLVAGLAAKPVPRIPVYVGPQVDADGFVRTDKQIADSVADVKAAVAKERSLMLTMDERIARVSVYVVGRGISPGTGGGEVQITSPTTTTVLPGGTIMTTP